MKLSVFYFTMLLFLFTGTSLSAQNEVLRERNSLYGISEFGVVVNIEKPQQLKEITLRVDSVRTLLLSELSELSVTILEDQTLRESDQFPILYLHINVMYAAPGIYPFSAELKFYQPAKLPLNNDVRTTASTWHNSFVGVVSPDMSDIIGKQSITLANAFRNDFIIAN